MDSGSTIAYGTLDAIATVEAAVTFVVIAHLLLEIPW